MVLLRAHRLALLAALLFSGCRFEPAVTGLGYQLCNATKDCMGGFVCLQGLCVPDCQGAFTVAWLEPVEPESENDVSKMCPGAGCEVFYNEKLGMTYLNVASPPGTFLELGSKKGQVEGCERVVFRFSALAPKLDGEPQGYYLAVVVRGENATGVVGEDQDGIIELQMVAEEEKPETVLKMFKENTHFYIVDTGIFEWPVRLRLIPTSVDAPTYFALREFEMSCCL